MKVRVLALFLLGAVVVAAIRISQPWSGNSEHRFHTVAVKRGDLQITVAAKGSMEPIERRNVLLIPNAALRFRPRPEQIVPSPAPLAAKENVFGDRLTDETPPLPDLIGISSPAVESMLQNTQGPEPDQPPIGTIWALDTSPGHVYPIQVVLGLSDAANTEVFSKDLQEGIEIATSEVSDRSRQLTIHSRRRKCNAQSR